jgi:MFS family permease
VLRRHPKNLLLAIGVGFGAFVAQGTLTTYLLSYAVHAGFPRQTVLNAITVSSVGAVIAIIGYSALSDRVGRRPVVLAGALATAVVGFLLFPLIDSGSAVLLTLAVVLGQSVAHPAMYGPLAALYTELFATRTRYTGASLGYQIAGLGAGVAPVVFAAVAGAGTGVISAVIAACCLVSVLCVLVLRESHRVDLADPAETRAVGVER